MCNYSESVRNYGREKGRVRAIIELYVSGDMSKNRALEMLEMCEQDFDELVALCSDTDKGLTYSPD